MSNEQSKKGYNNIVHYDNGTDCLENLYRMPDLIILDYQLGNENGLDILKKIKGYDSDIHVVFLSGQPRVEIAVDSLKYGSIDYVIKDELAMSQLNEIIQRIENLKQVVKLARRKKRINQFIAGSLILPLLITLTYYLFF